MKNLILILFFFVFIGKSSTAQGIADDFTMVDCYGNTRNLYSELDSNKVVIMEFIMTCGPCIYAGNYLEAMIADLEAEYPGKILFYQFGYSSSYTCDTMIYFKDSNNFHSIPFADGSHIFPLYGGFGMPTIAVVAGTNHDILFTGVGFLNTDTTDIGIAARNFFTHLSVSDVHVSNNDIVSFPNPVSDGLINFSFDNLYSDKAEYTIFDATGKIINKSVIGVYNNLFSINTCELSTGVYHVRVVSGSNIKNSTFVVQ